MSWWTCSVRQSYPPSWWQLMSMKEQLIWLWMMGSDWLMVPKWWFNSFLIHTHTILTSKPLTSLPLGFYEWYVWFCSTILPYCPDPWSLTHNPCLITPIWWITPIWLPLFLPLFILPNFYLISKKDMTITLQGLYTCYTCVKGLGSIIASVKKYKNHST